MGDQPTADKKGKVAKAGKDVTLSNLESGKAVWVRRSADQKKAEWATEYIQMGVIPAAATEGPSAEEIAAIKADLQKVADEYIADGTTESPLMVSRKHYASAGPDDAAMPLTQIAVTGKTVKWGQSTAYEVGATDPKDNIEGVTISATITSQKDSNDEDTSICVEADNTVKVVSYPNTNDTLVIKVTLTKDGQSIDKDLSIKFDNTNI